MDPFADANDSELPEVNDDNVQDEQQSDVRSPMEAHGGYRGEDWSPERLMFHQNLESFAERVGLVVGLQANGKLSQEQAYDQIRQMWKDLKGSKGSLLSDRPAG
jgi:hypothetical protein